MKKILTSIILLLAIALSLTSCDFIEEKFGDPVYRQLNSLIVEEHKDYSISISLTDKNSHTLHETYTATTAENGNTTINYVVERLNKFDVTDGIVTAPNSYKKVYTGYAVVNGENLLDFGGDSINIDFNFTKVVIPDFNFSKKAVANAIVADGKLTADVISQDEFLGFELTDSEMTLEVVFDETAIQAITLTYKTASESDAVVVYTFN